MAQQPVPAIENHFIAGLKTEFTGLNFPENAATDTQNCVYTLIGDVLRREGINYEANFIQTTIDRTNNAVSSYRWKNVGGDGLTEVLVLQVGHNLYFFRTSAATTLAPISSQRLSSIIDITPRDSGGNALADPSATECQFTDGNGFLFVFHPQFDPLFCTYDSTTTLITSSPITIQTRDFVGIPEPGVADNFRPPTLSNEHNYNLQNQGWTAGSPWTAQTGIIAVPCSNGASITIPITSQTNTTTVTNGSQLKFVATGGGFASLDGDNFVLTVTSYVTPFTSVTGTVSGLFFGPHGCGINTSGTLSLLNIGFIQTWFTQIGNFPSNSDIWWLYKNTSNVFAPSTTVANVQQPFGPAPKGSFILNEFNKQRDVVAGIPGLTDITTTVRPRTGAWFQGRVWFAGADAAFNATGDAPYTTWTENIYFSQVAQSPINFGRCYQTNDPTSQTLFDLLPTDGGVIIIQGSGSVFRLFPLENGLLVFAANGIWFITGSSGIGFAANDYTIRKISNVQNISSTSFVSVHGYPMFWNEEGIYSVTPQQQGTGIGQNAMSFQVDNLCVGTILSFYSQIPKQSKKFVRGDYNSIDYIVQWCYRNTNESSVTDRYQFDRILNYNVVNKAFYPYTLSTGVLSDGTTPWIHDVKFIQSPGGTNTPDPTFKYVTSVLTGGVYKFTFAEERDANFLDWISQGGVGISYTSFFITGYKLTGQAIRKQQVPYVYFFSRNPVGSAYLVQSIWDYATTGNSGKFSQIQRVNHFANSFAMVYKKIRLRGRGLAVQIKVSSVQGQPFDLMGWSTWNEINTGI